MATDVDEANSTIDDHAPSESNGAAVQLAGVASREQLFHDLGYLWRDIDGVPFSGASSVPPEC